MAVSLVDIDARMMKYSAAHCAPFQDPATRAQSGFSLIEIMVVVIMGILAALVVPNVMERPDQARAVAARQDISVKVQVSFLYRDGRNGHGR